MLCKYLLGSRIRQSYSDFQFDKFFISFMPSWFENAPQSVIDEYSSLFAHHNKLTVSSFDEDNEIVHLRAPDGTSIIFDMLKVEACGALIDDDAAVKFFARIIKGLKLCGEEIEIKFSDQFYNLKTRDEDLFDKF